ncbi:hypothetical protein PanWU01x14_232580 [Parasponia andersonii]|uniref:Uncharacterized protein n=1 Tax=Parasponia andersonii TaxID=3476 RepID=A0A2P5BJY1_PARAD|nr:hypothetical protein PanWU01x14_232580 [Parasponia andersonii]
MEKFDIYIVLFGDRHENRDQTVEILPRFVYHRSGEDPDSNWISYMSNLAILGTRNSVKRSVCGIEAPTRSWFFHKRTIERVGLVPDPPMCRYGPTDVAESVNLSRIFLLITSPFGRCRKCGCPSKFGRRHTGIPSGYELGVRQAVITHSSQLSRWLGKSLGLGS